jgi:hypothetical protein
LLAPVFPGRRGPGLKGAVGDGLMVGRRMVVHEGGGAHREVASVGDLLLLGARRRYAWATDFTGRRDGPRARGWLARAAMPAGTAP